MALSAMEFQLGVFRFLPTTQVETNERRAALSSHSDRSTYVRESQLFCLRGKTEYSHLEPHAKIKVAQKSNTTFLDVKYFFFKFEKEPTVI